jgi:hypothetical protein
VAIGDLSDPVSVTEAIKGVDELFLLIGNVADEFTQALTAYGLSKKAGLKHVSPRDRIAIASPNIETIFSRSGMRSVSATAYRSCWATGALYWCRCDCESELKTEIPVKSANI